MDLNTLEQKVFQGESITREEALWLYHQPLEGLCAAADRLRRHFRGNAFDLCAILNAKSGLCPEDCRFCAQSAHNHAGAEVYPLLSEETIVQEAVNHQNQGVLRFSIVTSGKSLSQKEVETICRAAERIRRECRISLCGSFGLLNKQQYVMLKQAGISRIHNNLETSRRNFPNLCTTHTFDDKIAAIRAAQAAGLTVCSGGIMGLGETEEDRIDMALILRELGIKSVPLNLLNPIPGTPLEHKRHLSPEDMRRIAAVYRFLLPDASIRLAGGRGLLPDKGAGCFRSGANAAISGDMLTTAGITVATDLDLLAKLGYEVRLEHE